MSKRVPAPTPRLPTGLLPVVAFLTIAVMACDVKQEQRIKDPDCEYCYELPSGVKYKTFEYYDP